MLKVLRLVSVILFLGISWPMSFSFALADAPNAVAPQGVVPQHLVIPSIEVDTPIVAVGQKTIEIDGQFYPIWDTAENDVGWHQGSGPPGQIGNTVLAGHSNGGRDIFRYLEALEINEDIFVATNQGWRRYRVAHKLILREQGEPLETRIANARWILPTEDERLTLITCWPYPASTHRLLVIAYPISQEPPPNSITQTDPKPKHAPPSELTHQALSKQISTPRQKSMLVPEQPTRLDFQTKLARLNIDLNVISDLIKTRHFNHKKSKS